VTNIPGPPLRLYMLGAQLKAMFPLVPIPPTQNLGIALFSYNGGLYWGFNGDWEGFPDLHEFVETLEASFEEYKQLAAAHAPEVEPSATHVRVRVLSAGSPSRSSRLTSRARPNRKP